MGMSDDNVSEEKVDNPNEDDDFSDLGEVCMICLDNFIDSHQLSCGHKFHKKCIEDWLIKYNNHCPACRTAITNDSIYVEKINNSLYEINVDDNTLKNSEKYMKNIFEYITKQDTVNNKPKITGNPLVDDLLGNMLNTSGLKDMLSEINIDNIEEKINNMDAFKCNDCNKMQMSNLFNGMLEITDNLSTGDSLSDNVMSVFSNKDTLSKLLNLTAKLTDTSMSESEMSTVFNMFNNISVPTNLNVNNLMNPNQIQDFMQMIQNSAWYNNDTENENNNDTIDEDNN
jgi:hypothetical protein